MLTTVLRSTEDEIHPVVTRNFNTRGSNKHVIFLKPGQNNREISGCYENVVFVHQP